MKSASSAVTAKTLLVFYLIFASTCSDGPDRGNNWTYDQPAGDDTTLPQFEVGNLKFQNTWVPNNAHAGMEFKSYFTIVSEQTPNFNVYVKETLVKLSTGVLTELQGTNYTELFKNTDKLAAKEVVPMGGVLVENLKANESQEHHLKVNKDKYFSLPNEVTSGTYAVIFSINEIQVDSTGAVQGEITEENTANTKYHAAATVIVGTPDKPNIRILHSSLSNNSFFIKKQNNQLAITRSQNYPTVEPPEIVLNLELEAMALDVTEAVEVIFELGVPNNSGVVEWHPLKMSAPVTDTASPTATFTDNLVIFPNPETGSALVNEEPSGHTLNLYAPDNIKNYLYNYPFDLNCQLRIKVDPNNNVDEWSGDGAPGKADNVATHDIKYLSRYLNTADDPMNRQQTDSIANQLTETMLGVKKTSGNKNSSSGDKETNTTEIDISEELKDPWGSVVNFVERPPVQPFNEFDTVYPEEVFDISKSSTYGKRELFAVGYQFKAHLYYQNFRTKGYSIPAAAKFGTYNWIKSWVFDNELTILQIRAQADISGFKLPKSYFQYDTHMLGIKLFAENYAFKDSCKEGCQLWNTTDGNGNERFAKQVEKKKEKYFTVAGVPLKVSAGVTGTGGIRGSVDLNNLGNDGYKISVPVGPFLNVTGVAEGSVSIAIVSAGVGIELTILDIYQKFAPFVTIDLKPGYQVKSTVTIGFEAPLEIKTLDGRLYAFVEVDLLFWTEKFIITFFRWAGLEWAVNWMAPITKSWSIVTIPPPELIGHYSFDDLSNCNTNNCKVTDSSKNDYKGQIAITSGSIESATDRFGRQGKAARFYDVDKVMLNELSSEYTNLNFYSYSVSAWVKPDLVDGKFIVGKGYPGSGTGFTGEKFWATGQEATFFEKQISLQTDRWHHLVISTEFFDADQNLVADSPTRHNVYIDGVLVASGNYTIASQLTDSSVKWSIGNWQYWVGGGFQGLIDDVRIFNYGISGSEVQKLYNEGGWGINGGFNGVTYAPFDDDYAVDNYAFNNTFDLNGVTEKVDRDAPDNFVYTFNAGEYIPATAPLGGADQNTFTAYTWVYFSNDMMYKWNKRKRFWQIAGRPYDENTAYSGFFLYGRWLELRWSHTSPTTSTNLVGTAQLEPGKMYMVATTFERTGTNQMTVKLYLNGILQNQKTTGLMTDAILDKDIYSIFGDYKTSYFTYKKYDFFTFLINDPKILSYAMSADQIKDLYDSRFTSFDTFDSQVAYYPLNGNTDDESGYNYDATGAPDSYTYDRYGNPNSAAYFDGTGSKVVPDFDFNVEGGQDLSVSFWMRPEYNAQYTKYCPINFLGSTDVSGLNFCTQYSSNTAGRAWANIFTRVSPTYVNQNLKMWLSYLNPTQKSWYHVYITMRKSGNRVNYTLYVDGTIRSSSAGLGDEAIPYMPLNMMLGTDPDGNHYKGAIDEVRFFERPLKYEEIKKLSDEGKAMVANYTLDNHVQDRITLDTATNNGAVPTSDAFLRSNRAYYFDGTDSLELPLSNPPLTEEFTISFWALKDGNCGSSCYLFHKGDGTANRFYLSGTEMRMNTGADNRAVSYSVDNNKWHHYVLTQFQSDTQDRTPTPEKRKFKFRMYINGQQYLENTSSWLETYYFTPDPGSLDNLSSNFVFGDSFKGAIDNIKIYNYHIDEATIRKQFSDETGIKGLLTFNKMEGGAYDRKSWDTFRNLQAKFTHENVVQSTGYDNTNGFKHNYTSNNRAGVDLYGFTRYGINDEMTVSFWFNKWSNDSIMSTLLRAYYAFDIRYGNGKLEFETHTQTGGTQQTYKQSVTAPDLPLNTWHQLVAKLNEVPGRMTLYIDGVKYIDGPYSGSLFKHDYVCIMNEQCGSWGKHYQGFYGTVDQLVFSNTAEKNYIYNTVANDAVLYPYPIFKNHNTYFDNTLVLGLYRGFKGANSLPAVINDHTGASTGFAHSFDGTDDQIIFRDSQLNLSRNQMSASVWVRIDGATDGCRPVISYRPSFLMKAGNCTSSANAASPVLLTVWETDTETTEVAAVNNINIRDGQWHHIVFVNDRGRVKLYVDNNTAVSASTTSELIKADSPIRLGVDISTGISYFKGDISTGKVFDYALTDTERNAL